MNVSDEAVTAALNARLTFKNQRGMDNAANLMRHILEAAAPHMLADVKSEAWEWAADTITTYSAPGDVADAAGIVKWLRAIAAVARTTK